MRHSKKLAALAIAAGVAITATAALAYWTTAGGGSGSAEAAADYENRIVVNQDVVAEDLVPGGGPVAMSGDFTNSNPGDVMVMDIHAAIEMANGEPWSSALVDALKPACTAADFDVVVQVEDGLVEGDSDGGAWSGTVELLNGADNQDNCKGAVPPIQFTTE